MRNKTVVRYRDKRKLKGYTADFLPTNELFHVSTAGEPGAESMEVRVTELKAIFFVKDLIGNPKHCERKEFDPSRPPVGQKIRVVFKDGEVLIGTTPAYQPDDPGFFVIPADPESNNERCYVVSAAVKEVSFL
jgi:hypothetical protein